VGTLEKALTGLNKAIDLNGKDPIAHTDRGRAYRRMKKFPAALADFEEALKIDPDYPDAYYERSLLRLTEGNFPGARSDWHKILEIDRKFWQVHLLQGMNSLGRGKWSEGTTQLKKGLRLVSMLPPSGSVTRRNNTRTKRSNMKSMMGDPRIEARELYEEGIRLSTRGKYDEALEALTEAIRIRPDYSQAYMRRGNIRRKQREWTDALEDYRRVLSLTKDSGRNTEKLEAIIRDLERRVENR
jgi:tetratricopeptide (TPR) repeat protein